MPKQDNKSKMAIPTNTKELAKKLLDTDLTDYVLGKSGKEGVKKFTTKQPTLRTDAPNDDPEKNDDVFNGINIKDDTTRRADYEGKSRRDGKGQDKMAYAESVLRKKLVEKYKEFNAQKEGAIDLPHKPGSHEAKEKDGDSPTSEPIPKFKNKIPKEAKGKSLGEDYVTEMGEPMSPAPAGSDNPGQGSDAAPTNNADRSSDKNDDQDKNSTQNSDSVEQAKEALESIAMCAAKLYEDIPGDIELPSWVHEKLDLAKGFLDSIEEEFGGDSEKQEDGEEEQEPSPEEKPTANKGGQAAMAKESVNEVLKPNMGAGEYIKDFINSDNPKFKGKSSEKRKQMALAAYYSAKRNK